MFLTHRHSTKHTHTVTHSVTHRHTMTLTHTHTLKHTHTHTHEHKNWYPNTHTHTHRNTHTLNFFLFHTKNWHKIRVVNLDLRLSKIVLIYFEGHPKSKLHLNWIEVSKNLKAKFTKMRYITWKGCDDNTNKSSIYFLVVLLFHLELNISSDYRKFDTKIKIRNSTYQR